jgi:hypothetical protein
VGCGGSSSSSQPIIVCAISLAPPGSSSWDTAVPTAVLLAADPKARVTDLLGPPLIYDGGNLSNKCGVIASSGPVSSIIHERLCIGLSTDGALHELICLNNSDSRNSETLPSELEIVRTLSDVDKS